MDMLTKQQAMTDILVVGGCCLGYVAATLAGLPLGWIILLVVTTLTAYVFVELRRRKLDWHALGFRTDNLRTAAARVGLWTAIAASALVAVAVLLGNSLNRPELLLLLPLYPLWGVLQQFVFQGILHRAVLRCVDCRHSALLVTTLLFAAVHVPDWRIVGLTLIAGLCWSWFYQRWPNVWVLGVSHGLLGGLTYPLLLGRNTLAQFF
jgi:membrane protease YdiL (CAAX protease family)